MLRSLLAAACVALPLSAQNITETFTFPNGTLIPGWTSQTGSWRIDSGVVHTTSTTWGYLTCDAVKDIGNCVIDVECVYPASNGVHFAGATARHPGSGPGDYLMTKIQDNSSAGNWNSLWLYQRGGTNTATSVTPTLSTTRMRLRTFVQGLDFWCQLDMDMDGIFEQTTAKKTLTSAANAKGLVGLSGYNLGGIDQFDFFGGMLIEDPATKPVIGTTYKMIFEAPLRQVGTITVPTGWFGMLSGGNQGIPLPGGIRIPLSLDAILTNSLGWGWNGVLTTQQPTGSMSLPIPNDKILVGLRLYACAVTLGGNNPLGLGSISNDHQFVIQ